MSVYSELTEAVEGCANAVSATSGALVAARKNKQHAFAGEIARALIQVRLASDAVELLQNAMEAADSEAAE